MSTGLIARSPDLRRLREEGYDIAVQSDHLLVRHVPYVNTNREVRFGTLVSVLDQDLERTRPPGTHVIHFAGEHPCHADGALMSQIQHTSNRAQLAEGLYVDHSFSCKPDSGSYSDYYEKVTRYVQILSAPAQAINPEATAKTFPVIEAEEEEESVFLYPDTASTRANIVMASRKLALGKLAIVGLGGTGSYVLDLVAKTHAREIHLFDGDMLLVHNAFRSPGAASREELVSEPLKVNYVADHYGRMRRNIFPHGVFINADTVGELQDMDFVFLCLDPGSAKKRIVEALEGASIPFIDVGMGVSLVDDSLRGSLRVTTSTPRRRDHFRSRVSLADTDEENEYDLNIQIADLNALNAALAVIRWKKLFGFYLDDEQEHHCTYVISGNAMINDDQP